jgi:NAD(P)-dependent dehydrogenase (short-subunit alcohol dehydrogenase family)
MAAATHHGTHSWARLRICQLAEGWRVFVACHNPDAAKLRCLAQDMLNVVAMDVTDAESVRNATTQLKVVAIDVLINSAGIADASGQKTGNVDYESWAHVFNGFHS